MLSPARSGAFLGYIGEAFLLRSRFNIGRGPHILLFEPIFPAPRRSRRSRRCPPEPPLDKPKVIKNPIIRTPGRSDKIGCKRCPYEAAPKAAPTSFQVATIPSKAVTRPPQDPPRLPQDLPLSTSSVPAGVPMKFKIEKHDGGIAERL